MRAAILTVCWHRYVERHETVAVPSVLVGMMLVVRATLYCGSYLYFMFGNVEAYRLEIDEIFLLPVLLRLTE